MTDPLTVEAATDIEVLEWALSRCSQRETTNGRYITNRLEQMISQMRLQNTATGQIYGEEVTMHAWSIANRVMPRTTLDEHDVLKREVKTQLAIAAQIGLNIGKSRMPDTTRDRFREKLTRIQGILDE